MEINTFYHVIDKFGSEKDNIDPLSLSSALSVMELEFLYHHFVAKDRYFKNNESQKFIQILFDALCTGVFKNPHFPSTYLINKIARDEETGRNILKKIATFLTKHDHYLAIDLGENSSCDSEILKILVNNTGYYSLDDKNLVLYSIVRNQNIQDDVLKYILPFNTNDHVLFAIVAKAVVSDETLYAIMEQSPIREVQKAILNKVGTEMLEKILKSNLITFESLREDAEERLRVTKNTEKRRISKNG